MKLNLVLVVSGMALLRVQIQLLRCIAASLFCLSLISCGESRNDKQVTYVSAVVPVEDTRQQVFVPASFTEASAQQLGNQLDSIVNFLHKKKGFNGTVLITKYDQVVYKAAVW